MFKKDPKKNKEASEATEETSLETPEETTVEPSLEESLQNQITELNDRLQRNLAEFDNFRKRTVKEKSEMYDIGIVSAVEKILPIVDNFERALNAAPNKDDNMYKGILMIYKQLNDSLKSLGAEAIECVGEQFNPKFHDAVAHEKNDEFKENTIIEELQKGYTYKEKIIRPSMVKVAN